MDMTTAVAEALGLDYHAELPSRLDRPIGIVGAGAIVNAAHLPAYRKAGFNVVAVTDLDRQAAARTAAAFEIPRVCDSVDELLAMSDVEVVDVAVTPFAQADIALAAIRSGKHLLCQKPFSESLEAAQRLVEAADAAGTKLAVNQQMRWDQVIRCTRLLLDRGWYGELTSGSFDVDILTDWASWPWMANRPGLEYFYHSVHYFDSIRFLFGEPHSVIASTARYPGQFATGETRTFTVLDYSDTCKVAVLTNHNNWSHRPRAVMRCQGTDGQSEGTLGALYDYPYGRPDTFEFWSRTAAPDHAFSRHFTERWIPDAFIGPMADLHRSIEEGREPLTSGRDNLGTLRIILAAYQSSQEGRRLAVSGLEEATA